MQPAKPLKILGVRSLTNSGFSFPLESIDWLLIKSLKNGSTANSSRSRRSVCAPRSSGGRISLSHLVTYVCSGVAAGFTLHELTNSSDDATREALSTGDNSVTGSLLPRCQRSGDLCANVARGAVYKGGVEKGDEGVLGTQGAVRTGRGTVRGEQTGR